MSEKERKITLEEAIENSMIYRWGPRFRLWCLHFLLLLKRLWWSVQRRLHIGWQGRLVGYAKEAREIADAEHGGHRPWYRPSFASWSSPEDKAREKKLRELESRLRAPDGEMTLGRLAAKMIEEEK